jgi:hypothetical protein
MVNYGILYGQMFYGNVEIISFVNKEQCTDGELAQALQFYEHQSSLD